MLLHAQPFRRFFIGKKNINDDLRVKETIRKEFDEKYYLDRYKDVLNSAVDPLDHYIEFGWREGRDPNSKFCTTYYLTKYTDVIKAGINPFWHYLVYGRSEGRSPAPDAVATITNESSLSSTAIGDAYIIESSGYSELIQNESTGANNSPLDDAFDASDDESSHMEEVLSPKFDAVYYSARYPDVKEAGIDPLIHYITQGWQEGRDPSYEFSTTYYLDTNADVKESEINPFYHYLIQGHKEGRLPKMPGGFRADVLKKIESLDERIKNWKRNEELLALDRKTLSNKISKVLEASHNSIVISVSHDDYTSVTGGIQVCLAAEAKAFNEKQAIYLNISPAQPLPCLSTSNNTEPFILRLICNGSNIGYCRTDDFIQTLVKQKSDEKTLRFSLIVHSLLGHKIENIIKLCEKLDIKSPAFWLHDYFSICPGYTLLRNDIKYCEAPSTDSQACHICVYGEERRLHIEKMKILFNKLNFVVVSPSEITLGIWKKKARLPYSRALVRSHCDINFQSIRIRSNAANEQKDQVQVAFIGYPANHKGWPVFKEIVLKNGNDSRYKFHHMGNTAEDELNLERINVKVTPNMRSAMIDEILKQQIDLVVLPNIWPETFNIVVHEAIAAGAMIATTIAGGNIPWVVTKYGRGLVFDNEKKLIEAFLSGEIYDYLSEVKRQGIKVGSLEYGGISADLNLE